MDREILVSPGHSTADAPTLSPLVSAVSRRCRQRLGCFLAVWLLFIAHAFLSTAVPGINEPHYLCKAKAFVDPEWCSRDFFLQSQNAHYCFFWLAGLMTQLMPLSAVAVSGRILSLAVVAWGWLRLGCSLKLSPRLIFLSAVGLLLIGEVGSFSGEWIVGGFESKVPAWGLGLAAVSYWLNAAEQVTSARKTLIAAGLLLGLSVSLHPVVGIWFVVSIGMAECLRRTFMLWKPGCSAEADRATGRGVCGGSSGFLMQATCLLLPCVLTSLPGLIPAFRILSDNQLTVSDRDLANFIQVFWRLKHHLDPTEFPASSWGYTAMLLTIVCTVTVLLKKRTDHQHSCAAVSQLLQLLWMSTLIAGVGVAIGWHTIPAKDLQGWQWRASLLRFYPFRLFDGLLAVTAALFISLLIQQTGQRMARHAQKSGILYFTGRIAEFAALLVWFCVLTGRFGNLTPAGYTLEQYSDWKQVCEWIRENTPADSLVLTPRESFAFKWFAQRAEYAAYKDCPQDAAGILEWNRRLWYLHDWTLRSSSDGQYDEADLQRLRRDTGIDYIVTRILQPFDAAPVHQGTVWQIYQVP